MRLKKLEKEKCGKREKTDGVREGKMMAKAEGTKVVTRAAARTG